MTPEPFLTVTFTPQTPLWTGGVDGTMDRIHETGIIGSLRWWFEAIVRALGGSACDPTKSKCNYQKDKQICDVCTVFGATGWKRRFSLRVEGEPTYIWSDEERDKQLHLRPAGRRSWGWYLPNGVINPLRFRVHGDPDTLGQLQPLIHFLGRHGAIGAKNQLGYGFGSIDDLDPIPPNSLFASLERGGQHKRTEHRSSIPSLNRFGFFSFRFTPVKPNWWAEIPGLERLIGDRKMRPLLNRAVKAGMVPVTPLIKSDWRRNFARAPPFVRMSLFGASEGRVRIRGKIGFSWAFKTDTNEDEWQVRGWCWFPKTAERGQKIYSHHFQTIWKMIADTDRWCRMLHVVDGEVTIYPDRDEWREWSDDELRSFLELSQ